MSAAPGDRIGPYEVVSLLGKGGMGEVYRAHDRQLNRDVAIKVLPAALANDADYLARFQREAQTLAALNHPNIAAIYDLEGRAIVMELVEGETLKGPLPLAEALPLAKQIAEALEAAHEKNIIHRDLKPGNVKVTPEGVVKVLDFGLAKAINERPVATGPDSPTLTMRATEAGLILGTAGYMSPEQAAGKQVDRRADIWSFGVVLYELLTGKRLFDGETVTHTLADVVRAPIDLSGVPLNELLERCLDRNIKTRLQHIGEARIAIESYRETPTAKPVGKQNWFVTAALVAVAASAAWFLRPAPPPREVVRMSTPLTEFTFNSVGATISPDGKYLSYIHRDDTREWGQVMIRKIDKYAFRAIPGADGATRPVFSADSQWIVYSTEGAIKKVSVNGGPPIVAVAGEVAIAGKTMSLDGTLVFWGAGGLMRLPPGRNSPETVVKREGGRTATSPSFLPDGQTVLAAGSSLVRESAEMLAVNLQSQEIKPLSLAGASPRYSPSGHILFQRENVLYAVPFDAKRLVTTGPEVPIAQDVYSGSHSFGISETGHLVYATENRRANRRLAWVDSAGAVASIARPAKQYSDLRLSPDGQRAVAAVNGDIWVEDFIRGGSTQLTTSGRNSEPIWTADGEKVTFFSSTERAILTLPRAGGVKPEPSVTGKDAVRLRLHPEHWSPDGSTLFFSGDPASPTRKLFAWSAAGPEKPLFEGPGSQREAHLSPDGKFIAYLSTAAHGGNTYELYVQPYPSGARVQVSVNGADDAFWSPDGKQLYYKASPRSSPLMAVPVQTSGDRIQAGQPRKLFDFDGEIRGVTPDGKRFLALHAPSAEDRVSKMHLVLNFADELRRLAPPR
ncbi:MAG: hypothetical protein FJW38_13420 [Acidobacteria bacterium]|nr:hypothetical protein [Acidobacteriota bacterium]